MKAIATRRSGTPGEMTVEERPVPARRPGQTLVRVRTATINQLANSLRTGAFGSLPAPIVLGNEGAGTVEESAILPAGTRVAVHGHGDMGVTIDGLYQQYVTVPDQRLLPLPPPSTGPKAPPSPSTTSPPTSPSPTPPTYSAGRPS
ncbi:alcohol dehydrogenase catalytic domain-containing protein [Streptomyces sp. NPDC088560]|uniref:alcohol dehydrogenase catalytic domain-containing protein n=1 Tax=Streptomyces sp. NPDC088560 TaxID=3365868 RepID=UPI00381BBCC4